jgi:hypothetical protein
MNIGAVVVALHIPDPTVSATRPPDEAIGHQAIALGPPTPDGPSLRDLVDAAASRPAPVTVERTERATR